MENLIKILELHNYFWNKLKNEKRISPFDNSSGINSIERFEADIQNKPCIILRIHHRAKKFTSVKSTFCNQLPLKNQ